MKFVTWTLFFLLTPVTALLASHSAEEVDENGREVVNPKPPLKWPLSFEVKPMPGIDVRVNFDGGVSGDFCSKPPEHLLIRKDVDGKPVHQFLETQPELAGRANQVESKIVDYSGEISPDGKHVLFKTIGGWSMADTASLKETPLGNTGRHGPLTFNRFSEGERYGIFSEKDTAGPNDQEILMELKSGEIVRRVAKEKGKIDWASSSGDYYMLEKNGGYLIYDSKGKEVYPTGSDLFLSRKTDPSVSYDGKRIALATVNGSKTNVEIRSLPDFKVVSKTVVEGQVTNLKLSPDGSTVIYNAPHGTIIAEATTGKHIRVPSVTKKDRYYFCPDGRVVMEEGDGIIRNRIEVLDLDRLLIGDSPVGGATEDMANRFELADPSIARKAYAQLKGSGYNAKTVSEALELRDARGPKELKKSTLDDIKRIETGTNLEKNRAEENLLKAVAQLDPVTYRKAFRPKILALYNPEDADTSHRAGNILSRGDSRFAAADPKVIEERLRNLDVKLPSSSRQ